MGGRLRGGAFGEKSFVSEGLFGGMYNIISALTPFVGGHVPPQKTRGNVDPFVGGDLPPPFCRGGPGSLGDPVQTEKKKCHRFCFLPHHSIGFFSQNSILRVPGPENPLGHQFLESKILYFFVFFGGCTFPPMWVRRY